MENTSESVSGRVQKLTGLPVVLVGRVLSGLRG